MSRLKATYEKEIIGKLMSKLSLKNKRYSKSWKSYFKHGFRWRSSDGKN